MVRTMSFFAAGLLAAFFASAACAGPWYVRGNLYCHAGVNDPAPATPSTSRSTPTSASTAGRPT